MATKKKKSSIFALESDMCAAFTKRNREAGAKVYPECGGWDLVLVWPPGGLWPLPPVPRFAHTRKPFDDYKGGMQIGIQAKLRPNIEVLAQTVRESTRGPHFRAVLVPYATGEFLELAKYLRISVYVEDETTKQTVPGGYLWETKSRLALPPIEPTWEGGGASPRVLSAWRVNALKICHILRTKGVVTKADFQRLGLEIKSWVSQGWLRSERTPGGWIYYPVDLDRLPDKGYEAERKKIAQL